MANIPMKINQGTLPKGDPCACPFFGNVGTPFMATLNIPGLNVGLPIWLWSTPNIPNVLEAYQMNALFHGHHMGANCSSSFKDKYGIPFSLPSCNKKSQNRRKRKSKKKNNSIHSSSTSVSYVGDEPSATASHTRGISLVTASHTSNSSSTSASHVEDYPLASASHAGGTSLVTTSHASNSSSTSANHVGDEPLSATSHDGGMSHASKESPSSASHVQDSPQTTTGHVGRLEVDKKLGRRSFKPNFPCKICKGYHLTHLCPSIPEVQRIWSESKSSSTPRSDMVSHQSHQPLVDNVVEPVQSLADYTPLSRGEVPNKRVCLISSTESSGIGGIPLSSNVPPPSSNSVSFNWDSLVKPHLPSIAPFQINARVNSTNIYRCMVDEGSSASIISSLTWKALGSPKLLTTQSQLLAYDRRPGEYMGVLPQLPITLGGKTILINMMVVDSPLDFNMLLGHDYVYAMNVVVSSLFRVMCFPHKGSIVTIDQLAYDNYHPKSNLLQNTP